MWYNFPIANNMLPKTLIAAVSVILAGAASAQSGSGLTTRYWDCCKPSCAWSGKAPVTSPVRTCDASNNPLANVDVKSGCNGGRAFACANNSPWAHNSTHAYGYAAVSLAGLSESQWCCACYQLTFTSGPVNGQTMIVQAINTGIDLGLDHFDLMIPGGGVGLSDGCTPQYGSYNGGAQYGGVSSGDQCNNLPQALRPGCNFRFGWFKNADNPSVNFRPVTCPAALTAKTGCSRL